MKSTGLKKYEDADVEHFTSNIGLKIRKIVNRPWRFCLKIATSRKIHIVEYPQLEKKKNYVFACNHSFDEDVISALCVIDRNAYVLNGSTDQTEHNPQFLALWANGMIYVDRNDNKSRQQSILKMERVLNAGNSIMLFPEGGYNNTEEKLLNRFFSGPWILSVKCNVEVVPIICFNDLKSENIYISAGEPIKLNRYGKEEARIKLRDRMATIVWEMIERYAEPIKRSELPHNHHSWHMKMRKEIYECQKWYNDVWEEELTVYKGHMPSPQEVNQFVDCVEVDADNAWVLAPRLLQREQERREDLILYLKNNVKLQK